MPVPRRVALSLDLQWRYKRHNAVFAGAQKYAHENVWEIIIEEFVDNSTGNRDRSFTRYDGVIARATIPMKERMARQKTPIVNVWASSPAHDLVPGVSPDHAESGRLRAEHLLDRGFRLVK
jgi:DNA-binding LacI/PurR family transcriptional regulator